MSRLVPSRWLATVVVLAGSTFAYPVHGVWGSEDGLPLGAAVGWIPADAAACSAVLRAEEQVRAVADSRAWGRLVAMPVWERFAEVWQNPWVRAGGEVLFAE